VTISVPAATTPIQQLSPFRTHHPGSSSSKQGQRSLPVAPGASIPHQSIDPPPANPQHPMSTAIASAHAATSVTSPPSPSRASPSSSHYQGGPFQSYHHSSSDNFISHGANASNVSLPSLSESMGPGANVHAHASSGSASNGGSTSAGPSAGNGARQPHYTHTWGGPPPQSPAQIQFAPRYGDFPPSNTATWIPNSSQGPSGPLPPMNNRGFWDYSGEYGPQGPTHLPPGSSTAEIPLAGHQHAPHEPEQPNDTQADVVPPPRRRVTVSVSIALEYECFLLTAGILIGLSYFTG
jgi:hypothetical protein